MKLTGEFKGEKMIDREPMQRAAADYTRKEAAGLQQPAIQDPPLRTGLSNLESSVVVLNDRIKVLEDRLYCVLQEPRPEPQQIVADMGGHSAMTRQVYDITTALHAMTRHIDGLIERLEI